MKQNKQKMKGSMKLIITHPPGYFKKLKQMFDDWWNKKTKKES
jgi:hypothetical protein